MGQRHRRLSQFESNLNRLDRKSLIEIEMKVREGKWAYCKNDMIGCGVFFVIKDLKCLRHDVS